MSRWIAWVLRAALSVPILSASTAAAATWSLGTHLELAVLRSDVRNSGSNSIVALPASAFAYQPALRVGFANVRHTEELSLDSGLFLVDEAGSTLSMLVATANVQHTFGSERASAPFVSLGLGAFREGGAARTSTVTTFGGGVGLRRCVHGDHGALRAELRADYLHHAVELGRPNLVTYGLRLGFDLWL